MIFIFVDKAFQSLGLRKKFIRHELFGEYFGPEKENDYSYRQVIPQA